MTTSRRELIRWALGAPLSSIAVIAAQSTAPRKPPRIKITDVQSFTVRVGTTNYQLSRVETDAGITGTSFIGCPQQILQSWVKPTLVGQDLFAIDRHLNRLQMQRGESGVQI